MALQCPRCRRQYDVTLFQFGHQVRCECGATIDLARGHVIEQESEEAQPQTAPQGQVLTIEEAVPQFVLVRHAEAAGEPSAGLTERGRRQALALARRCLAERVAAIYTSDAACCRQTAGPIASELGVRVQSTPLLGEGDPEEALAFIGEAVQRHPGGATLAVTHEAVCRAVLRRVLGIPPEAPAAFRVDPASVHRIEMAADGWRVALLNDTCHMRSGVHGS